MAATPWKSPTGASRPDGEWGVIGGDWTAANLASAGDGLVATDIVGSADGTLSAPGWVYGFGFDADVPAGATIDGIGIRHKAQPNPSSARQSRGNALHLVLDGATGTPSGTNQTSATILGTEGVDGTVWVTEGGAANLFGLSLTRAQIADPNFGAYLRWERYHGGGATNNANLDVDAVEMQVHYTVGGGGGLALDAPAGGFVLTGNAPALLRSYRLAPPAGSFILTGHAPDLAVGLRLDAPAGDYAATGYAPSLFRALRMETAAGAYTLTGHAPDFVTAGQIAPAAGSYALTGHAPSILRAYRIAATPGDYAITGNAPTLTSGSIIRPDAGSYAIMGPAPVIVAGRIIRPEPGAYALTGAAPLLSRALRIEPGAGIYAITGLAPTIGAQAQDAREADATIVSVAPDGVITIIGQANGPFTIISRV